MSLRRRFGPAIGIAVIIVIIGAATGCRNAPETVFERLSEARRLAADLLVQFVKASDAANRAVMAETDEASVAFAEEARQATQATQRDADALGQVLQGLSYTNEIGLLGEFGSRFAEYRVLDQTILELAVDNTNLKAQRLSFGPAQEAADAFRDALQGIASLTPAKDALRVEALVATAVVNIREIQVLQAPHIAEADEAAMTSVEKRMATSEAAARSALQMLAGLVPPAARPPLSAATAALVRFTDVNAQIIALSRRNTNVRSLALSLGQKRMLTAACEDSLHALRDALAKRGFAGTR